MLLPVPGTYTIAEMSGIEPTEFASAVEAQKQLWNESREVVNEHGDEIYTRVGSPVVVADETIGSHEYDEAKTERERQENTERSERAETVAIINRVAGESLPSTRLDSQVAAWDDLVERGDGIYRGFHPVMRREGVYVYGCPHLVAFEDQKPVKVVRLRGTKYVERAQPYTSQIVGPWLTCRIFERARFDVSDLSFTVIRYDRREHPDVAQTRILSRIHHGLASGDDVYGVDVSEAVKGFDNLSVNTFGYESRFSHESTSFPARLRRSLAIITGEQEMVV